MRRLLFEDPETVFDIDRLFSLLSGLVDQLSGSLVGDRPPVKKLALRDPAQWRLVDLLAADFDGSPGDELVAVYVEAAGDNEAPRTFDVLRWPASTPR
jgi:hypothetical protein